MTIQLFYSRTLKSIRERSDSLQIVILSGSPKSYEEYKGLVGQYKESVLNQQEIQIIYNKLNKEEDQEDNE